MIHENGENSCSTQTAPGFQLVDQVLWTCAAQSRPLSVEEKGVLARGLYFASAPKRIPIPEIIAAVEDGLSRVCPSEAQLTRTRFAGCLAKSKPLPTNLSPDEQKAIKAHREAETIVIAPAD